MPASYYEILGVDPSATDGEIRIAYHRKSLRYHPDRNTGYEKEATRIMVILNRAKDTLLDAKRRREYDKALFSGVEEDFETAEEPPAEETSEPEVGDTDRYRQEAIRHKASMAETFRNIDDVLAQFEGIFEEHPEEVSRLYGMFVQAFDEVHGMMWLGHQELLKQEKRKILDKSRRARRE